MSFNTNKVFDLIIIGGGQSASLCLLPPQNGSGLPDPRQPGDLLGLLVAGLGSLTLLSPAEHSSLPGWMMPKSKTTAFPKKKEVIDYLCRYEKRYKIPVHRPIIVKRVEKSG